jgi:hypothetical protein
MKIGGSFDDNSEIKEEEKEQDYPEDETIQVSEFIPENAIIRSKGKYHPGQTRHVLAIILVISLVISIFVFGLLHAIVKKEMIERLEDFSRYSITILSSLTGAAIGFFFGRDLKD